MSHPHQIIAKDNFVFVCDLCADKIRQFTWNNNVLAENPTANAVLTPAGSGPRHNMLFHPTLNTAYAITELSHQLIHFAYDPATGTLTSIAEHSTLPPNVAEVPQKTGGIYMIGSDYLVVSNQGNYNSVASFKVNADDGTVQYVSGVDSGGNSPRDLAILPNNIILAANTKGNNIGMDPATGVLTRLNTMDVP